MENETNDLLDNLDDLLASENLSILCELKVEKVEEVEEESVLIPLDYQIFTTNNGLATGKKEIIDTYKCDRVKGIVPIGKAITKAKLMKQAFKNKEFFVTEASSKILPNGKTKIVEKIIFQTN
jgi:hypothetical protein